MSKRLSLPSSSNLPCIRRFQLSRQLFVASFRHFLDNSTPLDVTAYHASAEFSLGPSRLLRFFTAIFSHFRSLGAEKQAPESVTERGDVELSVKGLLVFFDVGRIIESTSPEV